jgi:hypothetical protein
MLWPSARGFLRKTIEILFAVIISKFVIAIALAIGVAALGGAGSTGTGESIASDASAGLGTLLVGAVLLGLAAFSPFIVLKLVPVAEAALLAHGISRGPVRAGQTGLNTYSSTRMVSRLSGTGGGGLGASQTPGQPPGGGPPSSGGPVPMPQTGGSAPSGAGAAAAPPVAVGAAAVAAGKTAVDHVRRTTDGASNAVRPPAPAAADGSLPPRRRGDQ